MPTQIVTETCPAPECNLTEQDIEQFLEEMTGYIELFAPAFRRAEQLEWSKVYLRGLLGDTLRKNVEQMALDWGERPQHAALYRSKSVETRAGDCHSSTTGG